MQREIVIVGSGFAGLGMAIRLKQAGREDFVVLEQADGVGGTWRANHYPGAACDIESHLYSFSFAPNPGWSRTYAPQREILAYLEACTDRFGIRPHLRCNCAVTRADWDERRGRWRVATSDGETIDAAVLVAGCGGLSRPARPDIPGLDRFAGKMFHSARWDHGYALDGKRVAVVGTGASAIQIVPAIAPRVGHLALFQRTPPWILPKRDFAVGAAEQARLRRWPMLQQAIRARQWLTHELLALAFVVEPRILEWASQRAVRHIETSVADPALRTKLVPDYTMGCKRVLLSNDYYPALTRDNVELVTDGIAEVSARGVVGRDGREHAVDAIVLATGFTAAEAVAPFPIVGRGGQALDDAWRGGAEAFLGTTVAGFPNFFIIVGPNTGLGHSSMVFMIESQVAYIVDAVRRMRAGGWRSVEVRAAAQAQYNERLHARFAGTVWETGCTSWYRTATGKNTTLWPGFTLEYRLRTRRFRPRHYDIVAGDAASAADLRDAGERVAPDLHLAGAAGQRAA